MKLNRFTMYRSVGVVLGLSVFAAPLVAPAAVIALYPFDTVTSGSSASTDLNLNSTASSIFAGAGVTMVTSSTGNPTPSGAMQLANNTTEAGAITGNDYFEFTITPQSGYEMDLTSLTLQYQRSSTAAPTNLFIRSSIGSYGANLFADSTLPTASFETGTLTLSSLPVFQDLTSAVTFRIYGFGGSGTNTSLRFDNITLNGTLTAVPEVSSSILLVISLSMVLCVRRFGNRKAVSCKVAS